jgi:hypothetical protein
MWSIFVTYKEMGRGRVHLGNSYCGIFQFFVLVVDSYKKLRSEENICG